jgi:cell division protein FtsB
MRTTKWRKNDIHLTGQSSTPIRQSGKSQALIQTGRWLLLLIPLIFCVSVLAQTLRERQSARLATQEAEAITDQLQLENQRLREEIEALRTDPAAIERVAREELNMIRPNEIVLSIPEKKPDLEPSAPSPGLAP